MNDNIGLKIKEIRKEKKLTQSQLAKLINKSVITVRKWESGERTPNIDTIKQIATALDVPTFRITNEREVMDLFAGTNGLEFHTVQEILNDNSLTEETRKSSIDLLLKSKSLRIARELFKLYGYKVDLSCGPMVFIQRFDTKKDVAKMTFEEFEEIANAVEFSISSLVFKSINDFSISEEDFKKSSRYKPNDDILEIPAFLKNFIKEGEKDDE